MATSQNGWPVVPNTDAGRAKLTELVLPGTMDHPVRVLRGDVATIARWHVREYHARVEPIKPAGCWGWNVRKIGDGPDWSNHASATAWDLNAPDNPDGAPPTRVMTAAQIAECHALERESGGVLRWGGDWSDPDPMHWEIVGTPAQAAALANRIEEEYMAPTAQEIAAAVWAHPLRNPYSDKDQPAGTILRFAPSASWHQTTHAAVAELAAAVAAIRAVVEDIKTALPGPVGAQLQTIIGHLDRLTADPADTGFAHPSVAAAEYAEDHEPPAQQ